MSAREVGKEEHDEARRQDNKEKKSCQQKKVEYQENQRQESQEKTLSRQKGIKLSRSNWELPGLKITLRKIYIKEK